MKVLYISHVREGTGWARAAMENMLALDSVGIEVISRNVSLTGKREVLHPKLEQFEANDGKPDAVIQHVLPHHLEHCSDFPNIAYYVQDTELTPLLWKRKLNLMDAVWCPNEGNANLFKNKGKVVPHPTDVKKFDALYPRFGSPIIEGTFKFYTIADFNSRKNIEALLTAFHLAFHRDEPVSLTLKTSKFNTSGTDLIKMLEHINDNVKRSLKLYQDLNAYKPIQFIVEHFTDEQINSLHQSCDCYVDTSHGEAFCLPMFDAAGFGKKIVTSTYHYSNLPYFKDGAQAFRYECYLDNVIGYIDTFFEVGNGHDRWHVPIMNSLVNSMIFAYHEGRSQNLNKSKYSHEYIGNLSDYK